MESMETAAKQMRLEPASSRKVRLAAVGCGVIWKHHLEAVAACQLRRLAYTVVIEPDEGRRAAAITAVETKLGEKPRAFATLSEAIASDPVGDLFEAVDIMVPNLGLLHEQVALEAQRAGRHVLLEKPISVSVASGERILAAGRMHSPSTVLMVAENSQYWREVVVAQRLVAEGAIGEILTARAKFWESGHPVLNEWAADGSYDPGSFISEGAEGFVFDGGLHWLRPLRMLLGKATHVTATAGKTVPHMRGPGMMQALITFESGVTAVFEAVLAPGAISEQPFFVVQGTKGEIVLDGFGGGGRLHTVDSNGLSTRDINQGFQGQVGWDTGYVGEMQDFAAAVLDGQVPAAGAHEAVEDLRLMLALNKAAKTRRWEPVADLEPDLEMATLGLKL